MPVEQDANLNDELKPVGRGNRMPNGEEVNPREMGRLGVRMILDDMLNAIEGMGVEQLEALGVSVREIAEQRDEIEAVLLSIIYNEGHRPGRQKARTGAIRIAGHLKMQNALPAIRVVLRSKFEPPTIRAAAADAIGLMRSDIDLPLLEQALYDMHDTVARSAAVAIGKTGTDKDVDLLKRRMIDAPSAAVRASLEVAVNRIEERANLERSVFEAGRPRPVHQNYTDEEHIEVTADHRIVVKR